MGDTVAVVTGSSGLDRRAVAAIPADAYVIAADGGLDHALAAGLKPALLIGDLDSVSADALQWAEQHATVERHYTDKDSTDTELALAAAAAHLPERVILVAGEGDRLDHELAAIGALGGAVMLEVPVVEGWWGAQYIRVLHGPGRARLDTKPGATVSLLSLHGPCHGVGVTGVRWPLDRAVLAPLVGLGVSNEATGTSIAVSVSEGILTVVLPGGAP